MDPSSIVGEQPPERLKPTRRQKKAFAAAVSGVSSVTPDMYIAEARKYLGWGYNPYCDRCGGSCHSFDCSGLLCHVNDVLGIGIGCITSFVMAQMCWDHGLIIPYSRAEHTRAHWALIGANGGRTPRNGNGHAALGTGDGHTVEAMGRQWGVLVADWYNRGWDAFALIPGVNYTPPKPPEVEDVIIVLDSKKPLGEGGNKPYAEFLPPSIYVPHGGVRLFWGASINKDIPTDSPNIRLWLPKPDGDHKWVSMAGRNNDKGIVLIDDHGHTTPDTEGLWS